MTKKQLIAKIKELGGSRYSSMCKDELQRYLAQLEAQNKTTTKNKEEVQMTKEVTKIKEFKTRTEEHKSYTTYWTEKDEITDGQRRLYASLNRNFKFEEPAEAPKNAKEMSLLLYSMEVAIDEGRVERRSAEEIANSLKSMKQNKVNHVQTNSDEPSLKQIKWLKDLEVKLNRSVTIPKTKQEAFDLIKELDREYQKSLFKAAQAVAATENVEPTKKKIGFFQYIINYFKKG